MRYDGIALKMSPFIIYLKAQLSERFQVTWQRNIQSKYISAYLDVFAHCPTSMFLHIIGFALFFIRHACPCFHFQAAGEVNSSWR